MTRTESRSNGKSNGTPAEGPIKVTGVTGLARTEEPEIGEDHPWRTAGAQSLLKKEEEAMLERVKRRQAQRKERKNR